MQKLSFNFYSYFPEITWKMSKNRNFSDIRYSATLAEYSVPNIRPILTEYSAEYSVFGRSLIQGVPYQL